jgi:hypothetical protein
MLADIAFVRLRHGLDDALLQGKSSFSQSVAEAQQTLGPAHLTINIKNRELFVHNKTIKLIPADLAFYLWLLQRQSKGQIAPNCPSDGAPESEYAQQYLDQYQRIHGSIGGTDRTMETLQTGMTKAFFEQRKSRINQALKLALKQAPQAYLIMSVGKRPRTSYQILLQANQIQYLQEING